MKKNNKGIFLKVIKCTVVIVLLAVLFMNLSVIIQSKTKPNSVPSIFGYKPFIVLSGSMETEIYAGDLVFVEQTDPATLEVGDIIAFRDADNYVTTHRIINVVNTDKGRCFETKGDNNNVKDSNIVCPDSVEGKYHSKISKIGNVILFIQQPLGFAVMMMSIFIICIFIYLALNKNTNNMSDEELKEFEEFKKSKSQK